MSLIKLVAIICLTFQIYGCATIGVINHAKYHVDDVEVSIAVDPSGQRMLQWQSQPGYSGNLPTQQSCKYFMPSEPRFGSWITTKTMVEINSQFVNLQPTNPKHIATLISEFNKIPDDACRFLVYGEINCWGNASCSKPFTIHVVNNVGDPIESFVLPERNGMPVRKWPYLALAAVVDTVVIVATVGVMIIAAPVVVAGYFMDDKVGRNKTHATTTAAEQN